MMGWYHGWGWGGWLGMSLTMVVVWGLVLAAIVLIFKPDRAEKGDAATAQQGPGQILAERYARGEIDEAEYLSRMDVLGNAGTRRARRHAPTVKSG
jgi:putative membrane protein